MNNIFKAIGDKNRLKILCLLSLHELCVCEIEVLLELSQSNVSRHLAKLRSENIISGDKDAQWTHYKISEDFKIENEFLYKYLINEFYSLKEYKEIIKRCEIYKKSQYDCHTIRTDMQLVLKFLENKKK